MNALTTMNAASPVATDAVCPKCAVTFSPRRKDQRYCGKPCAKAATRNATRGPRTVTESAHEARRQEERTGRMLSLSNSFFETHPRYRAAFTVDLIAEARRKAELRGWLTRKEALRPWQHHQGTGRLHIAQCLDDFCQEVYRMRSFEVLDPETTLPPEAEVAFPALYYGPGQTPIYESGDLERRPCSWANRDRNRPARNSKPETSPTYDWRKIGRAMGDRGWQRYIGSNHQDHDAQPMTSSLTSPDLKKVPPPL
jgi:hypothetical protein